MDFKKNVGIVNEENMNDNNVIVSRYKDDYNDLLEGISNLYVNRTLEETKTDISGLKPMIKDLVSLMLTLMENKDVIKRLNSIRAQRKKGGKDIDIVYIVKSTDDGLNTLLKNYAKGL